MESGKSLFESYKEGLINLEKLGRELTKQISETIKKPNVKVQLVSSKIFLIAPSRYVEKEIKCESIITKIKIIGRLKDEEIKEIKSSLKKEFSIEEKDIEVNSEELCEKSCWCINPDTLLIEF